MKGETGKTPDLKWSLVGPAQARELGLGPEPPAARCPFCGRAREARGVGVGDRVVWVSRERCSCKGVVAVFCQ